MQHYFQTSMDLPPDKAKLLKQYDDSRKWEIVRDQVNYTIYDSDVMLYHLITIRIYNIVYC